jgi:hypothetical protein
VNTGIPNIVSTFYLIIISVFMMPLGILVSVQTKNMMTNETTSERFGRKREVSGS